ncbi:MAG: MFS transporter [Mailhella sp.]|nr:MFS transporter [Mailhella sp.]
MLYVALPLYWQAAGLGSLWEVGLILSLNRLARIPFNPLVGWMYSHLSTKSCACLAAAVALCVTAGYGFAHGLAAWAVLRVLWGFAWARLNMGGMFTVLDLAADGDRGRLTGIFGGTWQIGKLVGMLGGGFVADIFGLSSAAWFCSAVLLSGAAGLPCLAYTLPSKRAVKKNFEISGLLAMLRTREFFLVMLAAVVTSFIMGGVVQSTLSSLMKSCCGDTVEMLPGIFIGCATAAGIIQGIRCAWEPFLAPCIGRLTDMIGRRELIFGLIALFTAVVSALLVVRMPLPAWIGLLLLLQLCNTLLTTLSDTLATNAAKRMPVLIITGYTLAVDLGLAAGPLFAFGLSQAVGIEAVYVIMAGIFASTALVWLRLIWDKDRKGED